MWKSLQHAFEHETPIDLGIQIEVTDELEGVDLQAAFLAARVKPGCSALILAGGHWLGDDDVAERVREALAHYEEDATAFRELPDAASAEAELDKVAGTFGGCDPLSVLHRLDPETLWAISSDEGEDDIDVDSLAPDDPLEAYRAQLAQRQQLLASAPRGAIVMSSGPLRTYDMETAIWQLAPAKGRVVRLATTPAKAMLYVGFGGWNDCPDPHRQARVWEHWATTLGGAPAVVGDDTLGAIVETPVTTRAALVQLAREVVAYDGDSVNEGYLPLLGMLFRNTSITFWWD